MGAWEVGIFDNDMAADWSLDCCETSGITFIKDALSVVYNFEGDYLEVDECERGLAAAEVVADIKNGSVSNLPEDLQNWVGQQEIIIDQDLIDAALQTIARVMITSELKELWEESEVHFPEWLAVIEDLRARLIQ